MNLIYTIKGKRGFKNSYVVAVENEIWKAAGVSPFPSSICGAVIFIGKNVDGQLLGGAALFSNPFSDLLGYWGSDYLGFLPISENTLTEIVNSGLGRSCPRPFSCIKNETLNSLFRSYGEDFLKKCRRYKTAIRVYQNGVLPLGVQYVGLRDFNASLLTFTCFYGGIEYPNVPITDLNDFIL